MKNLEDVLKKLKKNKSRDPAELVNDIFKPNVAGNDLKSSILKLVNNVKKELNIPEIIRLANITSMWKKKGDKNNLENDRGVFIVSILRSIIDKLVYEDEYSTIDDNMSDANIGARKERNIRNYLFIVYGIINQVKKDKSDPIDISVFDVEKCFDNLWLEELVNDLYDRGLVNDKLALLYELNKDIKVAVKHLWD